MKDILRDVLTWTKRHFPPRLVLSVISKAKDKLQHPDGVCRTRRRSPAIIRLEPHRRSSTRPMPSVCTRRNAAGF